MAKKAKLDILEITIDENNLHDDMTLEKNEDKGIDEKRAGAGILSNVKGWVRKLHLWIILISVVILGLIVGIIISVYEGMDVKGPVEQKKQAVAGIVAPAEGKMALLDGFVVDQKDEKGNIRIVFCDVALDLEKPMPNPVVDSDRADVRNVIYTFLKKETVKEGLSSEGRSHIKERLKNELNSLFGENLVKNIYFMRYEVN
jgi:flagellar basal body-associated protein FliL